MVAINQFMTVILSQAAYDPEGAFSYMKAMVTLHYYNYMNMVRLNLVKWLRGLNHRDHQEYKEKCNTSLELIPMICLTSTLSVATLRYVTTAGFCLMVRI